MTLPDPIQPSFWKKIPEHFSGLLKHTTNGFQYLVGKVNQHEHYLLPALNGAIGDKLEKDKSELAIQMSFRENGKDIGLDELAVFKQDQGHKKDVLIFVHGLMSDEVLWQKPNEEEKGYGVLLSEMNYEVLYIRYNTGRHISENGRSLTEFLETFYLKYKENINQIVLMTHSMGGLVSRSAGYYGKLVGHTWIEKLSKVYLLGVPHDGSFLEKAGHLTTVVLDHIKNFHTNLISKISNERSNGIKDLRWGFLVDEDWNQPEANNLAGVKRTIVPPLDGVEYYIIVATISEDESGIVSQYFGDGLVGKDSATGESFYHNVENKDFLRVKVFSKLNHISLLSSLDVFDYIKRTLEGNIRITD
jgi:pimeloyl-ACP methyl ester carboxylesterase